MKKLLLLLLAVFAFQAVPVVYAAGEELPEIAPVDEPEVPPLSPPSPDDYKN